MLDAVLFDLDGTLTDPAIGITGSFRHALASVGHPVAEDLDLTWMIGPALRDNFHRHGLPVDLHAEAVVAFRARHTEIGLFEATLHQGVTDLLDRLVASGIPLGLATAKPHDQAVTTLDHFGIADRFTVVGAGVADGLPRSKAQIVADALTQLGHEVPVPADVRVAMVGDRQHDVDGGRHNGCVTVAVEWGYAEPGELDDVAPDHRVADMAQLIDVLTALHRPEGDASGA
jgi:phosphoglycolate phosphatase